MKKQKIISKVVPEHVVTTKGGKWFFQGKQIDAEMLDQLAFESESFKKSELYKFWQGHVRIKTITSIIKDSKDFNDVEKGKALLISLDILEEMMLNFIEQQKKVGKNKE